MKKRRPRARQYAILPAESGVVNVRVSYAYGRPIARPACENAQFFARIAKTATLTDDSLTFIEKLGFRVVNVAEQWEPPALSEESETCNDIPF